MVLHHMYSRRNLKIIELQRYGAVEKIEAADRRSAGGYGEALHRRLRLPAGLRADSREIEGADSCFACRASEGCPATASSVDPAVLLEPLRIDTVIIRQRLRRSRCPSVRGVPAISVARA